jgi:acyl-CoA synthetase (NDP forming)
MTSTNDLSTLFNPASVAVVGASPTNLASRAALANLCSPGYSGRVAAVNPRYDEVMGVPCSPTLSDIGFVPESLIVSVNRDLVIPVLQEAAQLGVRSGVVFGIGFAETGADGLARQEELKRLARESSIAVLGPNCQGIINFSSGAALYMDDVKPYEAGKAGLIAQSGSVATALINNRRGLRWRYAVSTGNEAVVNASDLLWYMVEDPECRVVCMFLEAIRDPASFFAACDRAAERDLPIVVLKTGTTEASMRAAEAHSGALAVPDRLVDALFKRHGVIRVHTLEELLETANALQMHHRPAHGGLATMTASGGQIELVLDAAEQVGLAHPVLQPATRDCLRANLPDFLAAQNPLDYWGVADEEAAYPALQKSLAQDPNVEIVMAVIDQTDNPTGEGRFQLPYKTALALAPKYPDKLFVLLEGVGGASSSHRVKEAAEAGVLVLSGLESGMRALGHLVDHARRGAMAPRKKLVHAAQEPSLASTQHPFSGAPAMELLAERGIPVAEWRVASGPDDAVEAADAIGYPVVAKVADMKVTHKTEVGGVIINLAGADAVREAVRQIQSAGHGDVLIQQQVSGHELIFGVTRHPHLGSFLVVGLGGIWTELLREVEIVPVGLLEGEADEILGRLRGAELLDGARGSAPTDRASLVRALECLDALAVDLGDTIASIDVNPVIATPKGVWAVDALVVPDGEGSTTDQRRDM